MKAELRNHASALGRHGAKKRWSKTSADERGRVMELVRKAKAARARAGKLPQNPAFAFMNAKLVRDNEISQGKEN